MGVTLTFFIRAISGGVLICLLFAWFLLYAWANKPPGQAKAIWRDDFSHVEYGRDIWRFPHLHNMVSQRGVVDDLIVERRTVCNTKKNESIVDAIPRIPLHIFSEHVNGPFDPVLGCRPRKQHVSEIHIVHTLPFRLIAKRFQCIENILVARFDPQLRDYCYGCGGTLSKVTDINNDWQTNTSVHPDFQRAVQLNVGIKPRPFNKHQMPIGLLPLVFDSVQGAESSLHAQSADDQQKAADSRAGNCRIERPSIPVFLGIVFTAVFGGFIFALWAIFQFHKSRPRLCAYLWIAGICCAECGLLFLIMSGLHPFTWGLPPQWLPAKWNPCPQDYRDYFPHVQNVSQKHLTSMAFPYYSKDMANVLAPEKQIAIIGSLCEGSSIRAIERMTGVHRDSVMRLGVRVGQGCMAMMSERMRDLSCTRLELDEIWGFIGKKEKRVRPTDDPRMGDVWTFCAIDADSKLGACPRNPQDRGNRYNEIG